MGNIIIMRWYSNLTIQKALAEQMENREVIWAQFPPSKDKPFWARRTQVTGANSIDLEENNSPMFGINIYYQRGVKKEI